MSRQRDFNISFYHKFIIFLKASEQNGMAEKMQNSNNFDPKTDAEITLDSSGIVATNNLLVFILTRCLKQLRGFHNF